jgi:hypothetical protein
MSILSQDASRTQKFAWREHAGDDLIDTLVTAITGR